MAVGLSNKEDRKVVLAAFRKAGYVYKGKPVTTREAIEKNVVSSPGTGASTLPSMIAVRIWNQIWLYLYLTLEIRFLQIVNASAQATTMNFSLMDLKKPMKGVLNLMKSWMKENYATSLVSSTGLLY